MQIARLDHRLHPGADAERTAGVEEVALNGSSRDPDELADVRAEIAFAPKELKVAQDLSERLGYYTYAGRAQSRPSGLSSGRRSQTESDQRRALMLPQELIQMAPDRLLVLRAGLPAIRGRKIVYYRERAFIHRRRPAPTIAPRVLTSPPAPSALAGIGPSPENDPLRLEAVAKMLDAAGLEPLPPEGASPEAVEAWVERFIDASAHIPNPEADHGR